MKTYMASIFLLLFSAAITAQSFQLTDTSISQIALYNYTITVPASANAIKEFDVTNISGVTKMSRVKKTILSITSGHQIGFNYGSMMYTPSDNYSIKEPILSGQTLPDINGRDGLVTYFNGNNAIGTSVVRYTVYDSLSPTDSVHVTITYNAQSTRIESNDNKAVISNAFPNPANDRINFTGNLKGTKNICVKIYSLSGVLIKTAALTFANAASLDVSLLDEGVYFYSLICEGETISTKRFIIAR